MGIWRRLLLVALLLLAPATRVSAAADEQHAFAAATNELKAEFYELAEKHLKEFVQTYTNSTRIPEAILLQGEALFFQTKYGAVVELLTSRQNLATNLADQYLFWRAEAHLQKGEYLIAADAFAKLTKDFPGSAKRVEATVREASARAQLGAWPGVIALLQQTNGIFQSAAPTNAGHTDIVQGFLLLGEAHLAQQNPDAAEQALQSITKLQLPPAPTWQLNYLLGRIRLAKGHPEEALISATNMLTKAAEARQPGLVADSLAFRAGILEKLGRAREAIDTYTNNLVAAAPAERQREALLKTTELYLGLNEITGAVQMLKRFRDQFPTAPMADLALLTLGELQLRQYVTAIGSNKVAVATNRNVATNFIQEAQAALEALAKGYPQSSFFGRGELALGWCLWLQSKMPECEKAFQAAVLRLSLSPEQATAYFKLADAQFQQNNFTNALTNYMAIVEKFDALPEVKTNLFEPALYQSARAALAAKELGAATNAASKLLALFPKGFHTDRALLLVGQRINEQGKPEEARKILLDLIAAVPGADLLPQAQLAVARTYEAQEQWPAAIDQYDKWLSAYTNHEARPIALYHQARAHWFDKRDTNAIALFTQFIAKYPTNELAPKAQLWVANYYYQISDFANAEPNFQLLFQNWPASELTWQARLGAGRSAFGRYSSTDAIRHFTTLARDTNCPYELRAKAMIAWGDVLVSQGSTNKTADYQAAIQVFNEVCQSSHTNDQIELAWGRLAGCYLQWAQLPGQKESLTNALAAFQRIIDSPRANVTARDIAEVGVGVVFEAQAQQRPAEEQIELLKQALASYLDVFYGRHLRENEKPDLWWTKKAGLEAARLAEKLQWWQPAINVYRRLKELVPSLVPFFESRIRKAEEHLPTAKRN